MVLKHASLTVFLIIGLFTLGSPGLAAERASQVTLKAEMVNPYLIAGENQNTFLRVGLKGFDISNQTKRTPVNVSIVLDRSGSMQGEKLDHAKKAAILALNKLNPNDVVSLVTYSDTVSVLIPATKASQKDFLTRLINRIRSGGSTALFAGVSKGAAEVRKYFDRNRVNRIILISDGIANVGPSSPTALGELGASLGREGISVTTIGLGLGYNEDLMTQLAMYSDGNHAFAESPYDLAKIFDYEFGDVLSVVAQEVQIKITCDREIKPIRVMGREAEIIGQDVLLTLNQLYGNQEKYIMLEVEVPASKTTENRNIAQVDLTYANMISKQNDRLKAQAMVSFTNSNSKVEQTLNRQVAIDRAEQIAKETSKKAVQLRDKGDIQAAEELLMDNSQFLDQESIKLNSPKLKTYSDTNVEDAQNLKGSQWNSRRKLMKKKQYELDVQQSY